METWQIAALVAIVLLAAYGITVKQFFLSRYDWRAFIPLIFAISIPLMAYYFYSGAQSTIQGREYVFALWLGAIFCLSSLAFFIALKGGQASIVMPLTSLNIVLIVIASVILFQEPMTKYKIVGIAFGLLSIILLSIEAK